MTAMNALRRFWPGIILVTSILTGLAVFSGYLQPLRVTLVFAFMLVCPGMAYIRLLRLRDPLVELVLAVALSLALDTLVAMVLLYVGPWSPANGLLGLISISLIGLLFKPASSVLGDSAADPLKPQSEG